MAFRAGNADAFARVMREFDPLVRSIAVRLFPRPFELEEAMQEAWVHAFRQRESLDPARLDAFPGWLGVLVKRRCLDLRRVQRPVFASEEDEAAAVLAEASDDPDPAASAEHRQLVLAVASFRAALGPGWREFFDLHFTQGLDYPEVAARLGISRLRCKYMKKVLAARARRDLGLRAALGRTWGGRRAP